MLRSEYPNYSVCKTCGRFNDCKGKKTTVASCDKHRAATVEEIDAVADAPVSIRIVIK